MATSLLSVLESMQQKIEALTVRAAVLRERNAALEETNRQLQRQIEEITAERDRASLDSEFLALSHRLASSPDTIIDARRHIAGLIRNIDRCIEMLKE